MKILVYVEGPSDVSALRKLLKPISDAAQGRRISLQFHPLEGKAEVLKHSGRKAAEHLTEHPSDWVFALPDLYPLSLNNDTSYTHRSFEELARLLQERFADHAKKVGLATNVYSHFRVHCLKHDLEALLLAVPDVLRKRLGTNDSLRGQWRNPVEDQNDQRPPKCVVKELFARYRKKQGYVDTSDAPWILEQASLDDVVKSCPQRFAPFVRELRALASGKSLE